ncbi:hypothetical protein M0802_005857 [Mischocyttarus mexicanus]|nr:hypothetical protein M0802_005857 [Mischocyttarus mexicanus]
MEDDNIVSSLFLPDVPNLKITTISFNKHILGNRLYCEELKRSFDQSFNDADQLKTLFNTVFNNSNPTKNCLILLYRTNSCSIPENLIRSFTKWFPKEKASIIVGMVKNFFICSSTKNSRVCKTNANCLSILIRGMDMETSILRFNSFYDGSKLLKKFRDGIILKTHTICIMITGECCMRNSVNRKFENFNKYFPNVPLFQIYGFETMSASSSNELHKKFYNKWEKIESTVFMIITYN